MSSKTSIHSRFNIITLVALCIFLYIPHWANAQQKTTGAKLEDSQVIETITKSQLMSIMKAEGYAVDTDSDGDLVWKIDGVKTVIFISKEENNLEWFIGFNDGNATLKKINEWNQSKRYSRTYLNDNGNPHLVLDLALSGGITVSRIKSFLRQCRLSLGLWKKEVLD